VQCRHLRRRRVAPRSSRDWPRRNIRPSPTRDGDNIAGAAPMLVEAIAKNSRSRLKSKYMGTWEEAQAAARDGKAVHDFRHLLQR
jgi:hypothetical protein